MVDLSVPDMPDSPMFIEGIMSIEWQEFFRRVPIRIDESSLVPLTVADIDDPTELGFYAGISPGSLAIVTEAAVNANEYTIYAWDSANAAGANSPYVLAGSSGFWTAIGGKYTNSTVLLPSTNAIYFGPSDTNGSWRIIRSGNDLNLERREGGVWTKKFAARAS